MVIRRNVRTAGRRRPPAKGRAPGEGEDPGARRVAGGNGPLPPGRATATGGAFRAPVGQGQCRHRRARLPAPVRPSAAHRCRSAGAGMGQQRRRGTGPARACGTWPGVPGCRRIVSELWRIFRTVLRERNPAQRRQLPAQRGQAHQGVGMPGHPPSRSGPPADPTSARACPEDTAYRTGASPVPRDRASGHYRAAGAAPSASAPCRRCRRSFAGSARRWRGRARRRGRGWRRSRRGPASAAPSPPRSGRCATPPGRPAPA